MNTFPGNATCAVGVDKAGRYVVILKITDLPSEDYANKVRELIEDAVTERIRAIGGSLEGWAKQ